VTDVRRPPAFVNFYLARRAPSKMLHPPPSLCCENNRAVRLRQSDATSRARAERFRAGVELQRTNCRPDDKTPSVALTGSSSCPGCRAGHSPPRPRGRLSAGGALARKAPVSRGRRAVQLQQPRSASSVGAIDLLRRPSPPLHAGRQSNRDGTGSKVHTSCRPKSVYGDDIASQPSA
jgi:hypothetical protein